MKKNFIIGFITGGVICATITGIAVEYAVTPNPYPVKVNGHEQAIEGYNINDNTYFKLRDIGDKVGFGVGFEDDTIMVNTTTDTPEPTIEPTAIPTIAPTVAPTLPTPAPVDNEIKIQTLNEKTVDRMQIFEINNKKYVNAILLAAEYDQKKYSINEDQIDGICLQTNDSQTIFKNIPGISFEYKTFIELDYYETTLYPYLNEYCK